MEPAARRDAARNSRWTRGIILIIPDYYGSTNIYALFVYCIPIKDHKWSDGESATETIFKRYDLLYDALYQCY